MSDTIETSWSFLTNHSHVLVVIARNPDARQRDIAELVGLTPGAVNRIVQDLEQAGYLRHERVGRRNRYEVDLERPLRHPLECEHMLAEIIRPLAAS